MFKHLIMFSPYIWSIMTVTSMFINMLFSSTLNTKDFLAPAHDLGGPKIQQSCSSRFNRVVHRYKKHASMLFMFTNTTQTLNLGKRNAGNILQHIHTLFTSSMTSTPSASPFQHGVFEVFHAHSVNRPGVSQ